MKRAFPFLTLMLLSFAETNGQTIPNPGFENWSLILGQYINPDGWITNASDISSRVDRETPGQIGNYALKLSPTGFAQTKFPFSEYPFTVGAYLKYNIVPDDSVKIYVSIYSGNTILTTNKWTGTSSILTWIPINISVTDSLLTQSDSVEILISSGTKWATTSAGTLWGTSISIDNLSISPVTGSKEDIKSGNVSVFPNPFNELISIKTNCSESLNFTLFDIAGKMVVEHSFVENNKIATHQIPSGIYLYEVRDKFGVGKRGKLIKN